MPQTIRAEINVLLISPGRLRGAKRKVTRAYKKDKKHDAQARITYNYVRNQYQEQLKLKNEEESLNCKLLLKVQTTRTKLSGEL